MCLPAFHRTKVLLAMFSIIFTISNQAARCPTVDAQGRVLWSGFDELDQAIQDAETQPYDDYTAFFLPGQAPKKVPSTIELIHDLSRDDVNNVVVEEVISDDAKTLDAMELEIEADIKKQVNDAINAFNAKGPGLWITNPVPVGTSADQTKTGKKAKAKQLVGKVFNGLLERVKKIKSKTPGK